MLRLYVLFVFLLCLTFSAHSQSIFVNEINYVGTNLTDGIGLAGPANVEINGWSLVFYNSDGTVSHTVALPTKVIPDLGNGHGEVWYDVAMLDDVNAFAVVNNVNDVVQFLSYGCIQNGNECSNYIVEAVDGIANGLISTSIQAIQDSSASSVQLIGTSLSYLGFIWSIPGGATPGEINTGQLFSSIGLPIVLESFKAEMLKTGNHITWVTSSEIDNDYFILEKSIDGVYFEAIQKIYAQNNTNQRTNYQYLDKSSNRSITTYYRLQQVSTNGSVDLSEIIHIKGMNMPVEVQPFPNPTIDYINITLLATSKAYINIINTSGQIVNTIEMESTSGLMNLDVQHLPQGQYFLQIEQNQQIYSSTFVKK